MHRFKRIATAIVGGTVLSPGHAKIVLPAPAFRAHVHLAVPGPGPAIFSVEHEREGTAEELEFPSKWKRTPKP